MLHQPITPPTPPVLRPVRLTVLQGQARVSGDPRVELTTVLGSCIACCLFDPTSHVGGMNHFLLAEPNTQNGADEHYGVYLMEVLINEMLAYGASRQAMRAHLYGGANMHAGMTRIGSANAAFASDFLERERITVVRTSLGGGASAPRRVPTCTGPGAVPRSGRGGLGAARTSSRSVARRRRAVLRRWRGNDGGYSQDPNPDGR